MNFFLHISFGQYNAGSTVHHYYSVVVKKESKIVKYDCTISPHSLNLPHKVRHEVSAEHNFNFICD